MCTDEENILFPVLPVVLELLHDTCPTVLLADRYMLALRDLYCLPTRCLLLSVQEQWVNIILVWLNSHTAAECLDRIGKARA